jgi:SAM-dependent methyltransferase
MQESEINEEYLRLIGMEGKNYKQVFLDCEICEKNDFEKILDKGRIGKVGEYGPVNIVQCRFCGHVMLNPRYESQFYVDYYKEVYKEIGNFGGEIPKSGFLDRQSERGELVRRFLMDEHDIKDGSMLDLGCSYGATMIPFKNNGWVVQGIDPEEASINYGQQELGLPVRYGFGENLPYDDQSIDLVVSLGALEHVHDFPATMTHLHRVIKPNGILFIRMRHNRPWGLIWEYFNKNHYRFFCEATHRLAVMRYGFDVLEYTDRELEGIPGHKYLVCKKTGSLSLERVEEAVANGLKDSPQELKTFLQDHHEKFVERATALFELVQSCRGDLVKASQEIDNGRLDCRLLDGDRVEVMERALFEARRVLEDSGHPIPTI